MDPGVSPRPASQALEGSASQDGQARPEPQPCGAEPDTISPPCRGFWSPRHAVGCSGTLVSDGKVLCLGGLVWESVNHFFWIMEVGGWGPATGNGIHGTPFSGLVSGQAPAAFLDVGSQPAYPLPGAALESSAAQAGL